MDLSAKNGLLQDSSTGVAHSLAKAQRSWDVVTPAKKKLQVKARVVTNPRARGERQLSVFRSWKFNAAVQGTVVFATDELLALGDDWTDILQKVES